MRKRINLNFILVVAVSIILSVCLTTIVSYRLFQSEVYADLCSFAELIDDLDLLGQMKERGFVKPEDELRISWISGNGAVLYDSYTRGVELDNHKDRPEIKQAIKNGEGFCVRKSKTMEQSIFFYAEKRSDGTIIRIAKEAGSIWNVYKNALPFTVVIAVFTFLISVGLAGYLTKVFVRPIERMAADMNHLEEVTTYKELMPFIERISSQHKEALRNAKARQEFTANVSHELKTPLTSISGYSELIANGMASQKEGRHFAGEIHKNAQRLLTLIDDILQLSELDFPLEHKISFDTVDVYELCKDCMEMLQPVADKHGISLSLKGTPLLIHANKELIQELLYNLCDNAIRYNQKGGHVWITVTKQLTIQDDGIGISKKYQKRVFLC